MATCKELKDSLKAEQKIKDDKQKEIEAGQIEWEKNKLWYDAILGYWEKIDKAFRAPEDIIAALDITATSPIDCLKSEATAVLNAADSLAGKMKPYIIETKKAFNETDAAIKLLQPEVEAVPSIKTALDQLAKNDEVFKKSEINKALEAVFKNLDEIRTKSEDTLRAALNPIKNALDLKYSISGENGLIKHIADMKGQAEESRESAKKYHEDTEAEKIAVQGLKAARDLLISQHDAADTLVKAYVAARTAINCTD